MLPPARRCVPLTGSGRSWKAIFSSRLAGNWPCSTQSATHCMGGTHYMQ